MSKSTSMGIIYFEQQSLFKYFGTSHFCTFNDILLECV